MLIIVIIFALLVLGISGIMAGKDITTILALIAGYVLGKATMQKRPDQSKVQEMGPDGPECSRPPLNTGSGVATERQNVAFAVIDFSVP
ncbi:MAG: hypothetical protein ACLPKB_33660 [Xanthobacteraceae bacterium]